MSMPAKTTLHTTVWLTPEHQHLAAPGATITHGACTVTASGARLPGDDLLAPTGARRHSKSAHTSRLPRRADPTGVRRLRGPQKIFGIDFWMLR